MRKGFPWYVRGSPSTFLIINVNTMNIVLNLLNNKNISTYINNKYSKCNNCLTM